MNATTGKHRLFIAAVLLAVLLSGQLVYAQDDRSGWTTEVPQWVRDRQQYETTFVYVPQATQVQVASAGTEIPQWAIDRQQYETTYLYMPPAEPAALVYGDCAMVQAGDF